MCIRDRQDLVGGRIDGFIDPVLGALSYYKGGMLKILAVTSETRLPNLPDVPTVGEVLPGYQYYSWYGLWAPAGTPAPVSYTHLDVYKRQTPPW